MAALYYHESGRFSIRGVTMSLLTGAAVGAVLAFIYAYAILYIPLLVIRVLLAAGFGVLLAFLAVGLPLGLGKIHNARVRWGLAALLALLAWYASWAVWVWAFLRRQDISPNLGTILFQPDLLWRLVVRINEVGAWRFRGTTPTGVVLWVVWSIEAAIILGLAMLVGGFIGGLKRPFCETCERWLEETKDAARVAAGDAGELKLRLEAKDTGFLEKLGAPAPEAVAWVKLDLWSCPQCGRTNTVDATSVAVTLTKEGKPLEQGRTLFHDLLFSKEEAERLRATGQRLASPGTP